MQVFDEEYYYGRRYYDPNTGRWITRDPAGMTDGPNMYVYCGNNPVNYYDPEGLFFGVIGEFFEGLFNAIIDFFTQDTPEKEVIQEGATMGVSLLSDVSDRAQVLSNTLTGITTLVTIAESDKNVERALGYYKDFIVSEGDLCAAENALGAFCDVLGTPKNSSLIAAQAIQLKQSYDKVLHQHRETILKALEPIPIPRY